MSSESVTAAMWLGLLGPFSVCRDGAPVFVPAAKQRAVLAVLAVRAGQVVSFDALAEAVWDGAPPRGARATLRSYVKRLRQALGPRLAERVVTREPGYLLDADTDEVDMLVFDRLYAEGAAAVQARAWQRAFEVLDQALALWRGEPLADVGCESLRRDLLPRLVAQQLQAVEWRIDAGLALGRHGGLIAELTGLVAAHPLRERFCGQLMLALYRCGRQGEALAAYQRTRRALVDELGVEPSPELREIHRRILACELRMDVLAPGGRDQGATEPAGSEARVPQQLPAAVSGFVGRAAELAVLNELASAEKGAPTAVVISAVSGTAGVGKTALALHWAHQVAAHFPDGQLYANLRGYDPDQPLSPDQALSWFLSALGVPGQDIPLEVEERAARYRTEIAGRRMLVLLDNAAAVEQVRPLLPGTPSCAVLVTSRDSLAGLIALHGAHRLELDLLPADDAIAMLRTLIGARVDAEPEAAAVLAAQCARLPLALRVGAELAGTRPSTPLAELVTELADRRHRLDLLDPGGDPRAAVRGVFSWSYRQLPAGGARAFRLLGLHPGADCDAHAAAALTGTRVDHARQVLALLARAHLIRPIRPGRYGMHDLLRAYATDLAQADDGEQEQRAAMTRLLDHYLGTAATAMDTLYPDEQHSRPRVPAPASPVPPLADRAAARGWLENERPALVAACGYAARHGWPTHTIRLARTLFRYLDIAGHYPDALTVHTHARDAASCIGDRAGEAHALTDAGLAHWRQGRYEPAGEHIRHALALFREAEDHVGETRALANLGLIHRLQGRYAEAIDCHQQALAFYRQAGEPGSQARALDNLGVVHGRLGHYAEAADHHQQALKLYRELGARDSETDTLTNLGVIYEKQGRYQQAAEHLRHALAIHHETTGGAGMPDTLTHLGDVYRRQGDHQRAVEHHRQALHLYRKMGDRAGQANALNGLGETLHATGQYDQARQHHTSALVLAVQTGDRDQQARAHAGLGNTHQRAGEPDRAHDHWQRALRLYTDLDVPEADDIRRRLGALDRTPGSRWRRLGAGL